MMMRQNSIFHLKLGAMNMNDVLYLIDDENLLSEINLYLEEDFYYDLK